MEYGANVNQPNAIAIVQEFLHVTVITGAIATHLNMAR